VHRTPSAVSMQVKRMEEVLGRPVFVRDSRSVALTEDGRFLLEHARRMLELNRMALARFVQPDLHGEVRLGAPDHIAEDLLPDVLRRLAESHPGVLVNVTVAGSRTMAALWRKGALDLAILDAGVAAAEELPHEPVLDEALVWAMCEGGVAAERDPLPVAVWESDCSWRQAGTRALEHAGRRWRLAFQSAHVAGQRAAVLADLAVAPMTGSLIGGGVVAAGPEHGLPPLPQVRRALVRPEAPSPPVRATIDYLKARLAARQVVPGSAVAGSAAAALSSVSPS